MGKIVYEIPALRRAKRLTPTEYTDPVFWEDCPLEGHAEGYFANAGEAVEAGEDDGNEHPPAWLWAATSHSIEIDSDAAIDAHMDDLHDGAEVPAEARDALAKMLREWCARPDVVAGTLTWEEDHSRVIVLDAGRFEREIAE